jgi:hypothetical protein
MRRQPRHCGHERRLVHIAPSQVVRAGEEIELVPVESVTRGHHDFEQDEARREANDRECPEGG